MSNLSEKEKQMFLKIGLSERMFEFCATIDQLYNMAVYCVEESKQEGEVVESLKRCVRAMRTGVFRHTPEFDSLIIFDDTSDELCDAIGPHHGDRCSDGRVQSPNAQFTRKCEVCEGSGLRQKKANTIR